MEKNIIRLVETNFAEITKLLIKTFPGANKRVLTNSNEIKILVAFSPHLVKKRKKERKKEEEKEDTCFTRSGYPFEAVFMRS